MNQAERETRRRKRILEHARTTRNVVKTCRDFGVSRSTFYLWRRAYQAQGDVRLIKKKPSPHQMPNQTPPEVVEKVLHLRRTYPLGPIRIVWYLERYHAIRISDAGVYRILRRYGLNRLSRKVGRRAVHTKPYNTQVPGHHVQVDVKFLSFVGKNNSPIKRYPYTAIDDATRIRALKVIPAIIRKTPLPSLSMCLKKSRFVCRASEPTAGTNSRPSFTGTSKTRAFATSTSSRALHSSTARWNAPIGPIRRNSIRYSTTSTIAI